VRESASTGTGLPFKNHPDYAGSETAVAKTFTLLETPRLALRPIRLADWPAIHRYMSDPITTRWLPEGRLDEAHARAFARKNAGRSATAVAVIEGRSGELVGHMPFHPWFGRATHEVGWVMASDRQGRGYATEAARALIDFAFATLGCHRVVATCQPENVASWRVMEKLGMRREAHFRQGLYQENGEWWDEYFYALLAAEHPAAPPPPS
jgi:[ribosomal protein S5]-alanine N-acetyltransferase